MQIHKVKYWVKVYEDFEDFDTNISKIVTEVIWQFVLLPKMFENADPILFDNIKDNHLTTFLR